MADSKIRGTAGSVVAPEQNGESPVQHSSVLTGAPALPEYFDRILKNKDRIIRSQAKRIESLESEVERLRVVRETLSSQLAVLSYKLELSNLANDHTIDASEQHEFTAHLKDSKVLLASAGRQSGCDQSYTEMFGELSDGVAEHAGSVSTSSKQDTFDRSVVMETNAQTGNDNGSGVIEELSSKYGGYLRARRAATVIQQTFRQYTMNRSFAKLRLEAGESRRSRRFGHRRIVAGNFDGNRQHQESISESCPNEEAATLTEVVRDNSALPPINDRTSGIRSYQIEEALSSAAAKLRQQTSASDHVEKHWVSLEQTEDCSSSRSLSPLPPPMDPVGTAGGDLPSVCFETMLDGELNASLYNVAASPRPLRLRAPVDLHSTTSFPSQTGFNLSPQQQTARSHYVVGIPKDSGVRKVYDFPHMPILSGIVQSQQQLLGVNATMQRSAVHNHAGSLCNGSIGQPNIPLSTQACHNRKQLCSMPSNGAGVNSVCGVGTDNITSPCSFVNTPASYFNLSSSGFHSDSSPIWKRKSDSVESCDGNLVCGSGTFPGSNIDEEFCRRDRPWSDLYPGSATSSEDAASIGSGSNNEVAPMSSHQNHFGYYRPGVECMGPGDIRVSSASQVNASAHNSLADRQRKRSYRLGLNLFNKNPEEGIRYLIAQRFVDNRPSSVARFLITRKGLSRQKIGDYLGNLQQRFNMDVLGCFAEEIDLTGLQVDEALRNFQAYFRMPGEAQKIERLMEAFASCYCECNPEIARRFRRTDTVFLLAFAIIMLNTDLHNKNIKPERKMKLDDFVRNLRGIDGGDDIDRDLLAGIYERTSAVPFKPAADHVTQVMKVENMIIGKKPVLTLPYRRLVCYCRLYEVQDPNKRDRSTGQHQREIFLFNDILMITKSLSKKKDVVSYSFRQSFPLFGMVVYIFETQHYQYGIQLTAENGSRILGTYCARNERDRAKFVEDLKEAIAEMNEMVMIEMKGFSDSTNTLEGCLETHRSNVVTNGDFDVRLTANRLSAPECGVDGIRPLHKSLTSSSLVDVSEGDHSGSSASLDSGLPSTSSGSTASCQEMGHSMQHVMKLQTIQHQLPSADTKFGLFTKKNHRLMSKSSPSGSTIAEF